MMDASTLIWIKAIGLIMIFSSLAWAAYKKRLDIAIGLGLTAIAYSVIVFILRP